MTSNVPYSTNRTVTTKQVTPMYGVYEEDINFIV